MANKNVNLMHHWATGKVLRCCLKWLHLWCCAYYSLLLILCRYILRYDIPRWYSPILAFACCLVQHTIAQLKMFNWKCTWMFRCQQIILVIHAY